MTSSASLFRRVWQPLKTVLSRLSGPRTVWGFVRADGVYLPDTRISNHSQIVSPERLDIGDHVYVGHFSVLDASGGLHIGEGCQIAGCCGVQGQDVGKGAVRHAAGGGLGDGGERGRLGFTGDG